MTTNVNAVSLMLSRLLLVAEDALTAGARPMPEHRYITHGDPAWDCCDLLVVFVQTVKPTTRFPNLDSQELRGGIRFAVDINVALVRCVPTVGPGGELPSGTALTESALELSRDLWAIYHEIACKGLDGSLVADCPCDFVGLSGARALAPYGGCAGYQFTVTVELAGIT